MPRFYHTDTYIVRDEYKGLVHAAIELDRAIQGDFNKDKILLALTSAGLYEQFGFRDLDAMDDILGPDGRLYGEPADNIKIYDASPDENDALNHLDEAILLYTDGEHKDKSDAVFASLNETVKAALVKRYAALLEQAKHNGFRLKNDFHIYPNDTSPLTILNNEIIRVAARGLDSFRSAVREEFPVIKSLLRGLNDNRLVGIIEADSQKHISRVPSHIVITDDIANRRPNKKQREEKTRASAQEDNPNKSLFNRLNEIIRPTWGDITDPAKRSYVVRPHEFATALAEAAGYNQMKEDELQELDGLIPITEQRKRIAYANKNCIAELGKLKMNVLDVPVDEMHPLAKAYLTGRLGHSQG